MSRKVLLRTIFLFAFFLLTPILTKAATINVPGSEQLTIQDGIDASDDGDIVLLADGTYQGAGNYNIDFKGKSITVKSSGGAENCIIDCQQNGRGFLVYLGETVTFEGLTVKNGDAGDNNGGGIYALSSSRIDVVNCIFESNSGGAISHAFYSTFTSCTFTSNSSAQSGGAVSGSNSTFTSCTFTSNSSSQGGGAVGGVSSRIK